MHDHGSISGEPQIVGQNLYIPCIVYALYLANNFKLCCKEHRENAEIMKELSLTTYFSKKRLVAGTDHCQWASQGFRVF